MTITRTFCSASLLALAAIMGPVVRGYAREPCCDWVYGKYINLKTGKEVKPPKVACKWPSFVPFFLLPQLTR